MNKIIRILNTLYSFISFKNIYINACTHIYFNNVQHENYGDDLNYYIIKKITGRKIINIRDTFIKWKINYMFIGSILDMAFNNTIVWGAGFIGKDTIIRVKPLKIYAVRGKLTRKALLQQGIECPEIYGDPALLLPYIYNTQKRKKYKVGIIPHVADQKNKNLLNWHNSTNDKSKIILLNKYRKFEDIINEILECEIVLSSSLHGLIIADAYKIPNVWVKFSNNITGGSFKFLDYFSSVGRKDLFPYEIKSANDLNYALENVNWEPIKFDYKTFINSCPIKINIQCYQS